VRSPIFGTIEYAEHGAGLPLLFSHPLFGGCDAGIGLAQNYAGDGFRVIAPSRFGYLGSTLPREASPAGQADAYALLLDERGVDRALVFGYSGGGPSAIQFALRHPDRTAALVLMASALPGTSSRPSKPVMRLLVGFDLAFWLVKRYLPALLDAMFVAKGMSLTREQLATVRQTQAEMLPVRARRHGVLFDIFVSNPAVQGFPLERIALPTLIFNAEDDPLSAFDNAVRAAQRISQARLVAVATGGHLLLGSEQRVRDEVAALSAVVSIPPDRGPGV
jgi:pimeloyl-ACP methyl ester carboxylesterase